MRWRKEEESHLACGPTLACGSHLTCGATLAKTAH
jgi:hypothetical protein